MILKEIQEPTWTPKQQRKHIIVPHRRNRKNTVIGINQEVTNHSTLPKHKL